MECPETMWIGKPAEEGSPWDPQSKVQRSLQPYERITQRILETLTVIILKSYNMVEEAVEPT